MVKKIIFIFAFFVASCGANATTINQAITLAEKNNSDFLKSDIELDISSIDLFKAYSQALPNVSIIDKKEQMKMRYENGAAPDRDFTSRTESFNVEQNISLHKIIPNIITAHKEKAVKSYSISEDRKNAKIKIVMTFLELYKHTKTMPLINEMEKVTKSQMESMKSKFEYDRVGGYEFSQIASDVAKVSGDKIKIESGLNVWREYYKLIIGEQSQDLEVNANLVSPYKNLSSFIDAVAENNSKYLGSKEQLLKAKYGLAAKSMDLLPDVKVGYSKNRFKNLWYLPSYPDLNQEILRAEVSIPIFDGGRKIADLARQTKEVRLAFLNSEIEYQTTLKDASLAYGEFEASLETVRQYEYSIKSLESALEKEQIKYNSQRGSYYSLLSVKRNLLDIKIKLINAKCDRVMLYYKMTNYLL